MNCTMKLATSGLALLAFVAAPMRLSATEKAVLQNRVASTQKVTFDVYLPIQHRDQLEKELDALHDAGSPKYHKWLTPAQFHARFSPSASQVAAIQKELDAYGLKAELLSPRHMQVVGAASDVELAFGTILKSGVFKNGRSIVAAAQPITPPSSLVQSEAAVVGLSDFVRMRSHAVRSALPENRYSAVGVYWFDDIKQAYKYPSVQALNGRGVTIGILMDGAYNPPDMTKYFSHEKIATPNFSTVTVDGGAAFNPNGDSFETHLDLQQTGGMAPAASIIHYNIASLSDAHILDGLDKIVTDNKADVVSMSFGGAEVFYTKGDNGGVDYTFILKAEDDYFAEGNAYGITFIASSGDSGALGAPPVSCFDTPAPAHCGAVRPSASFPASSPHVTGVGGTNLITTYTGTDLNSTYVAEEAYGDQLSTDIFYGTTATGSYWGSGGGTSVIFKKPSFQSMTDTGSKKFRTVPDVSGHMGGCPGGVLGPCNPDDSADIEALNGSYYGVIGTSASAPDFAGLTALAIQNFASRMGNENYYIYDLALAQSLGVVKGVFNQAIPGYNGLYSTSDSGYNRVLGNGTVNGVNFLLAPTTAVAGTPQTPTNP